MAANTLLLVASHTALKRDNETLIVTAVMPRRTSLLRRLEEFGATVTEFSEPHPLCEYSGTYNKLLGLHDQKPNESRLLLDNDIVLLGDLAEIENDMCHYTMGGYADRELADLTTRNEISAVLGLGMLDGRWIPYRDRYEKSIIPGSRIESDKLYFNSGVVSSPAGLDLREVWERHSRLICEYFGVKHTDQRQRHAFGSDQLSFATAVAEINRFKLLPKAYNYRAFNFMYGDLDAADIRIVHQVGISRYMKTLGQRDRFSLRETIRTYYDQFMIETVRADSYGRKQARLAAIENTRDRVLDVIQSSDIDDLREFA